MYDVMQLFVHCYVRKPRGQSVSKSSSWDFYKSTWIILIPKFSLHTSISIFLSTLFTHFLEMLHVKSGNIWSEQIFCKFILFCLKTIVNFGFALSKILILVIMCYIYRKFKESFLWKKQHKLKVWFIYTWKYITWISSQSTEIIVFFP